MAQEPTTSADVRAIGAYLADRRRTIEASLARALPVDAETPALIVEAMRYAIEGGGKRLRPCLTLAVAEALAGRADVAPDRAERLALPGACAVECIHTYSLVHDDLPAMDDDTLRRGRPTTHVVYGDGVAVLAGDGLLTEAFRLLADPPAPIRPRPDDGWCTSRQVDSIAILAAAAGAAGMVGGQTIDLDAAGRVRDRSASPLDAAGVRDMHARKTGALIRAAAGLAVAALGAGRDARAAIDAYARELGLAFQIVDDILDVEGSAAALGKTAGKDAAAGKPTYPALFGLAESSRLAADCVERAKAALASADIGGRLADIADWSLARRA